MSVEMALTLWAISGVAGWIVAMFRDPPVEVMDLPMIYPFAVAGPFALLAAVLS